MPRIASDSDALLKDLSARFESLVAAAKQEGREDALAEVRGLVGGATAKRGPGRPRKAAKAGEPAKPKKKRQAWRG